MKKCIMLFLVVLVFTLSACTNLPKPSKQESDYTAKDVINSDSHSDLEGIRLQISGIVTDTNGATLVVNWSNDTEHTVAYEKEIRIERYENGEWKSCSVGESVFDAIAGDLRPHESDAKEYVLSDVDELSAPGTYRFYSACYVDTENGQNSSYSVWAEFIVE